MCEPPPLADPSPLQPSSPELAETAESPLGHQLATDVELLSAAGSVLGQRVLGHEHARHLVLVLESSRLASSLAEDAARDTQELYIRGQLVAYIRGQLPRVRPSSRGPSLDPACAPSLHAPLRALHPSIRHPSLCGQRRLD